MLLALLLVTPTLAAPLQTYSLMSDHEPLDLKDDSAITTWTSDHMEDPLHVPATYMWVSAPETHHSSTEESGISSAMVWPSDTTLSTISSTGVSGVSRTVGDDKVVIDPNASTYLPLGAEPIGLAGDVTPFVLSRSSSQDSVSESESETHMFLYPAVTEEHVSPPVSSVDSLQFDTPVVGKHSVVSSDENVPVKNSTSVPENGKDDKNISGTEGTTVSINGGLKSSAADYNSTVVNSTRDLTKVKHPSFNSSESVSLLSSSNISLDPMADILHSYSQGIDKPFADTPRLITRDLRNSSEASLNTSSQTSVLASHDNTSQSESSPQNIRAGKAASFFPPQTIVLHPTPSATVPLSRDGPESFPFPQSSDTSDVMHDFMQGYKPGPKSSEEFLNPRYTDSAIKDSSISELEDDERRLMPAAEGSSSRGSGPFEDVEMGDGPYSLPESSTNRDSKLSPISKLPPIPSSDLVLPTEKAITEGDGKPLDFDHSAPGTRDKGRGIKVIPPLTISSRFANTTRQSGRQPENATKNGHVPSSAPEENSDGSMSVGTAADDADSSTVISNAGILPADVKSSVLAVPSKVPGVKQVTNATRAASNGSVEESETTVLPTVVPISNGRVAAAAAPSSEPHHGLDAASITGISLGILVFAALVGAVSFVLYRRRFLNKPQTLNDKCSNPDSSGYIDDSTLRENSEEMYSLDNDSFLNSLEAMTIQNYWTDNVKHTKL